MSEAHVQSDALFSFTSVPKSLKSEEGDLVALTDERIDEQQYINEVKSVEAGAVCTFCGTTRNSFAGREVTRLEYEAYIPLALKSMLSMVHEARELAKQGAFSTPSLTSSLNLPSKPTQAAKSNLIRICIVHRLGVVPPLETSIVIAVSSAHRRESFAACEWLLEAIKRCVPIWKREWYSGEQDPVLARDGASGVSASSWKENFEPFLRQL